MSTPFAGVVGLILSMAAAAVAQPEPKKVEIVSVTGCLREPEPGNWQLVAATEPVPSVANAPPKPEIPTAAPTGKLAFTLIGVSEFNLPTLKDKTLVVRGLLIKDTPKARLNVTSVVEAVPTCAASAPK
jgi:hypothetical protein